jgi:hypothetical protein
MLVLILYLLTHTYAIAFPRFDWTERAILIFFFSSDIMMRDKGDERFALSGKKATKVFLYIYMT